MELLSDPQAWASLLTLTLLEIVLGVDNLIFIAILAEKLPPEMRARARRIGLSLALLLRIALLFSISWLVGLTQPLFTVLGWHPSARDLILLGGGLFLLAKATREIHEQLEGEEAHGPEGGHAGVSFIGAVVQILILDIVFSLDSVITAVGMSDDLPVMIAAVVIAMGVMLVAAAPLSAFVNAHPTVLMLSLGFLILVGMSLVADGMGFHIPKGYLYAAIGFSIGIEALNQIGKKRRQRKAGGVQLQRSRVLPGGG